MRTLRLKSKDLYFRTQIERSAAKFRYCKVSFKHVFRFKKILRRTCTTKVERILCLGTRNGREVDLFRLVFFFPIYAKLISWLELKINGWRLMAPILESLRRSDVQNLSLRSAVGVEINPQGKRKDVHVGSFDNLPVSFRETFDVIYSNSFDQSMDPTKTAHAWLGAVRPGGVLILGFNSDPPTESDPTGDLDFDSVMALFPGELKFFQEKHSNYTDIIIQVKSA